MQSRTVTVGEQFYSITWKCAGCNEWHQETCDDDRRGARKLRAIFRQLMDMGTDEIQAVRVKIYRFTDNLDALRGFQTVEDVTVDVNHRVVKDMLAENIREVESEIRDLLKGMGWTF